MDCDSLKYRAFVKKIKKLLTGYDKCVNLNELLKYRIQNNLKEKIKKLLTNTWVSGKI